MKHNIYVFKQAGSEFYKIGITKKPLEERIMQLQTGNPNKIEAVVCFETKHNYRMEVAVHAYYRLKRVDGEWFQLTEEDLSNFKSVCQKIESDLTFLKKNSTLYDQQINEF